MSPLSRLRHEEAPHKVIHVETVKGGGSVNWEDNDDQDGHDEELERNEGAIRSNDQAEA